jgi:hypothetical protein
MLLELQQVVMPKNAADGTLDEAFEPPEGCHDVAPVVAGFEARVSSLAMADHAGPLPGTARACKRCTCENRRECAVFAPGTSAFCEFGHCVSRSVPDSLRHSDRTLRTNRRGRSL